MCLGRSWAASPEGTFEFLIIKDFSLSIFKTNFNVFFFSVKV